jgi:LysR family transcriptional regulator, regulator for genes of the gallate degradation pathway
MAESLEDESTGSPSLTVPNIRHLRAIEAVARNASVNRASAEINLSQPAVTQAITKMELTVGRPLFDRRQNGSYPTAAGEVFLHRVRRFLDQIDRALSDVKANNISQSLSWHVTSAQIRCLLAIARSTSFSQAARLVGISTASLHRAAREIEATLQRPLYQPTKYGLVR